MLQHDVNDHLDIQWRLELLIALPHLPVVLRPLLGLKLC